MIKIVLADDDTLILSKLNSYILNDSENYTVVGQFSDGLSAMYSLKKLEPDLVILDMDMPGATGVDIAKYIQAEKLNIQILALSNYDNFNFVKPMFKFGARDYILKNELNQLMFFEKLNDIRREINKNEIDEAKNIYVSQATRERFLRNITVNPREDFSQSYIDDLVSLFGKSSELIFMHICNFDIMYSGVDSTRKANATNSVLNICNQVLLTIKNGTIAYINNGNFIVILNTENLFSTSKKVAFVKSIENLFVNNLKKYLNVNAFFSHKDFYAQNDSLQDIYKDLYILTDTSESIKNSTKKRIFPLSFDIQKDIFDALNSSNVDGCKEILDQILDIDILKNSIFDTEMLFAYLIDLNDNCIMTINPNAKLVNRSLFNSKDLIFCVTHIKKIFDETFKILNQTITGKYSKLIQNALTYIHSNYSANISLSDVSLHCNVSDAYLSKQFKKELSVTLIQYLTNHRINMAKHYLLNANSSLNEISVKCGFRSYNYFIKVFTDITEHTPSQFRSIGKQ